MWDKVSWLRKQHDSRDWVSSHQPSDLKSNALTTTGISQSYLLFSRCTHKTTSYDLNVPVNFTIMCFSLADEEGNLQWSGQSNMNRPQNNQGLAQSPTTVTDTLRFEELIKSL